MAEYIEREAFIADQRHLYCENCDRRKGMKNGKLKFVYAIGEVPCRACDIGDLLDSLEDYPAADVVPVVRCADCKWFQINMRQDGYLPKGVPECECRHWCGSCDPTDFCSYGVRKDGDGDV